METLIQWLDLEELTRGLTTLMLVYGLESTFIISAECGFETFPVFPLDLALYERNPTWDNFCNPSAFTLWSQRERGCSDQFFHHCLK